MFPFYRKWIVWVNSPDIIRVFVILIDHAVTEVNVILLGMHDNFMTTNPLGDQIFWNSVPKFVKINNLIDSVWCCIKNEIDFI